MVQLDRRIRPDRQIRAVGEDELRGTVFGGFHDFAADDACAGVDLNGARDQDAAHIVADDRGDADGFVRASFGGQRGCSRCEQKA